MGAVNDRKISRSFFIKCNTDPAFFHWIEEAAFGLGTANKHGLGICRQLDCFLDRGIVQMDIQMRIDCQADWTDIRRRMPGNSNPHRIAK